MAAGESMQLYECSLLGAEVLDEAVLNTGHHSKLSLA